MFRSFLLLVLLAGPASAQSFYPNIAGSRYCELRSLGASQQEAIRAAIAENWSNTRIPQEVVISGSRTSLDIIDFRRWVARCK